MKERTKLLKKAVLTGVGASSNVDRIKEALNDALNDLVKVGQELLDELEEKGKLKTDAVQSHIKGLQEEAKEKAENFSDIATKKVQNSIKSIANELGFVTKAEFQELIDRINALEGNSSPKMLAMSNSDVNQEQNSGTESSSKHKKK